MEVSANIKYIRISPKKVKGLARSVVGMNPVTVLERLSLTTGKASQILLRVIKSAHANATNGLKLDGKSLKIKTIEVTKGAFLKRWNPVSRGMAHQIKKRTCNIKVVLEQKTDNLPRSGEAGKKQITKSIASEISSIKTEKEVVKTEVTAVNKEKNDKKKGIKK